MLLSRAAAADARPPARCHGRDLTPAILNEEYWVRRRAPDHTRPIDLTPKEQISVRIICIYRAGIRQPNWEQQT